MLGNMGVFIALSSKIAAKCVAFASVADWHGVVEVA
jgi:hypothetical protein